jgi:chorismate mutase
MQTKCEFQLQIIMVGVKESTVIVVCQAVWKDLRFIFNASCVSKPTGWGGGAFSKLKWLYCIIMSCIKLFISEETKKTTVIHSTKHIYQYNVLLK